MTNLRKRIKFCLLTARLIKFWKKQHNFFKTWSKKWPRPVFVKKHCFSKYRKSCQFFRPLLQQNLSPRPFKKQPNNKPKKQTKKKPQKVAKKKCFTTLVPQENVIDIANCDYRKNLHPTISRILTSAIQNKKMGRKRFS